MIRDDNGAKAKPRRKAADILLSRLGTYQGLSPEHSVSMTEREVALVNKQLEKMYNKIEKWLIKARGEDTPQVDEDFSGDEE